MKKDLEKVEKLFKEEKGQATLLMAKAHKLQN